MPETLGFRKTARIICQRCGFKPAELARRSGLSRPLVTMFLHDQRELSQESEDKLLKAIVELLQEMQAKQEAEAAALRAKQEKEWQDFRKEVPSELSKLSDVTAGFPGLSSTLAGFAMIGQRKPEQIHA